MMSEEKAVMPRLDSFGMRKRKNQAMLPPLVLLSKRKNKAMPTPLVLYRRSGTLWEGRYKSSLIDSEGYLLTCYRYSELNPVRAGMAEDASGYRWSSYGVHASGQADELIRDHPCYLALGATDETRQAAYQALFHHQVDDASLKAIRQAVNSGTALGSERFKDEIEATLARSVRPGTPGRPKKQCGLGLRGK